MSCYLFFFSWLVALYTFLPVLSADPITRQTPTVISTAGVNASDPRVGIAQNGTVIAAWIENGVVKSSSLPLNGSWSTPATLSGSGASSLRLGVSASGSAVALWLEGGAVVAATKPSSGNWSASTTLSGLGTATLPALAVDSTGNAVAVWVFTTVLNVISVQSSTRLVGGNWQLLVDTISGGTSNPTNPAVSIGSNGTVYATWKSTSSSNDVISSSTKTLSGGSWASTLSVIQATANSRYNYPRVIVDSSGNATVLWFSYNQSGTLFTNVSLLSSQFSVGNSAWTQAVALSSSLSNRNPADLLARLSTDSSGNVIALWTSSNDGATFNVETAFKLTGSNWTLGGALALNNLYAFDADISTCSSGDTSASLMYYDGSSIIIQSTEAHAASIVPNFWGNLTSIVQGTNRAFPRIATILSGNTLRACTVWLQHDGTNTRVEVATGSKTILAAPTNLAVSQQSTSFGVFIDYYNTITWQASSSSGIAGYAIYRNGIFVNSVSSSTLQYVDHNSSGGSVTYGVAAFDSSNLRSPVATVTFP